MTQEDINRARALRSKLGGKRAAPPKPKPKTVSERLRDIASARREAPERRVYMGQPGRDGANGRDGKDGRDGKNGRDGRNGVDGKPGKDGRDGRDAASIAPEEIAAKLNELDGAIDGKAIRGFSTKEQVVEHIKALKGNDRIDISNIRNGEALQAAIQNRKSGSGGFDMSDQRWHGGGSGSGSSLELEVEGTPNVDQSLLNLVAGTNMAITDNGDGSVTFDATGDGTGTVTSVSVVSANGLAGTVATATTTPAITLSTTVNAPALAGNGTAIAAATTTGSGSTVVLATSPTLVTPDLGTPSAVVLTNGTGLPISTGVSGLGANVATFLATPSSANLAAAVTDETGSGALVFGTSPTIATPTISGTITFPDNVRQTFNPGADAAGINVGSIAGDPGTPSNGDLWYDSTANELTARINGANVALGAGVGFSWVEVTGTSQAGAVNTGYILNNAGLVTLTIPSTAPVGSVLRVAGKGAGGWRIAQNASEIIHFGNQDTTTGTGGRLDSTNRYDSVELLCTVADTEWTVLSSVGNVTVT